MKNLYIITLLTSVLLLNSGCATYMAKKHWDKAQQESAVRVEADGNQVMVGVDLTAMTYLKDNWQWALPAALADGALIYGAYYLVDEASSDSDSRKSSSQTSGRDSTSISVQGDGNTVQVRGDETLIGGE